MSKVLADGPAPQKSYLNYPDMNSAIPEIKERESSIRSAKGSPCRAKIYERKEKNQIAMLGEPCIRMAMSEQ